MKLHGTKGDVSVIVASGAWRSRRLTSRPGDPMSSDSRGSLTAPTDAAANMTQRNPGDWAASICCSIIVLSFTAPLAQKLTSALVRVWRSVDALLPVNFRLVWGTHFFPWKRAISWDRLLPARSSWYRWWDRIKLIKAIKESVWALRWGPSFKPQSAVTSPLWSVI